MSSFRGKKIKKHDENNPKTDRFKKIEQYLSHTSNTKGIQF